MVTATIHCVRTQDFGTYLMGEQPWLRQKVWIQKNAQSPKIRPSDAGYIRMGS